MGISTYVRYEEKNGKSVSDVTESSLALGGATYGCTTTELTAAYVPFGNLGSYYEPTTYTKVTDHKGEENILIQSKPTTAITTPPMIPNIKCCNELLNMVQVHLLNLAIGT